MRFYVNGLFFILLFLGAMIPLIAYAELPIASPVLANLPAAKKIELISRKKNLDVERGNLHQEIQAHNKKCGSVEANTPLDSECKAEMATIENKINTYKDEVAQYEKDNVPSGDQLKTNKSTVSTSPVGVIHCEGQFFIFTKDGKKLEASDGAKITLGTRIKTGLDGHVKIMLLDETIFTIGPNSDMVINEFVFDPKSGAGKIAAKITQGIFRWVTGKIGHLENKEIKVDTPVDVIGIRGTDFEASIQPDGSGYINLYSGKLEITGKNTKAKVLLRAGHRIELNADGTFGSPSPLKK